MKKTTLRMPSPALIVALIALFVALGGTSYAAINSLPANSVGTKQLKNSAVTRSKIKNGAVTAGKINPSGLTVPNARNADKLDSLDSTSFLRNSKVTISQERGWTTQQGGAGTVQDYSNVQLLNGASHYYLSLASPNTIGVNNYYLDTVTICYDVDAPSQISTTKINRSNTDNYVTSVVSDSTTRSTAFPSTECYSEAVNDTGGPVNSAYYVELITTGTTVRMIRVTATFLPS